jgi:hypothetical protein
VACALKHQLGLSLAKSAEAMSSLCGERISAGGLAQLYQRVANKLDPDYEQLRQQLLSDDCIHTDETSWWMGRPTASLWVFCRRQGTYYRVVEHRDRQTLYEVTPPAWPGTLVSDCLSVYDNATPLQHKCYAHHTKAIKRAMADGGPAVNTPGIFLNHCMSLLRSALDLRAGWESRPPDDRQKQLKILNLTARILLDTPRVEPREESVRLRLFKQIDHLFVFLEQPGVAPTNNLAERQLRPAVIARKVSCGQRTLNGADAWQVPASLAASAKQTASSFIEIIAARCSFIPP